MANDAPDPTQIIAAAIRRIIPRESGAAEVVAQVAVHELQRNGWLIEWEPVRLHGFAAHPPN